MFARVFGRKGKAQKPCTRTIHRRQIHLNLEWLESRTVPSATVVDFEDLSLTPNSYWNGSDGSGGFTSRGASFNNSYDQTYGTWGGWAYSNVDDSMTAGYGNQYAAYTGTGVGGSGNYAVAYWSDPAFGGVVPTITIPAGMQVQSAMFTNTTYPALSMLNGDQFAKKFGPDDWFKLTVTGEDASNNVLGSVALYLAQNGSIVNTWQSVNLSSLSAAKTLEFSLSSTDNGSFGMNTPAYFAMDDLMLVPSVTMATSSLANGTAGTPYQATIAASGGTGTITLGAPAASLPPGLTLSTSGVLSGTPTIAGSYSFPVTATDSVGASASQSYTITISAGPFTQYRVTVVGTSAIPAGNNFLVAVQATDAYGNAVAGYAGPSSVTASISPASAASNFPTTVSINRYGLGFFQGAVQKAGSYTITVANGSGTGNFGPVTVTPNAAAKLAFAAQPASTPTGITLPPVTVQVEDTFGNVITSDNSDSVTLAIASGPGPFLAGSTTSVPVHNGVATFNNLTLVTPGDYSLSVLVPGLYTGPNSNSFTIAPLQILPGSFAGTASGFSLQFNAPFLVSSMTPVLYGAGFAATSPAPSVTLTGPSGAVEGSLVTNPGTNSITFVETDTASMVNNGTPLLPDGTYTVDVRASGATGFQTLNSGGGLLDGLGTGTPGSGDFQATFTVNAAATGEDVLWVPATADGPGQPLEAPGNNQSGGGYPLYLRDSTGSVTNVQVTLNYNPALLTVTGVTGAGFTLLGSSTPGQAVLQYSGLPLLTGSQTPVGFITAQVPGGTTASPVPYKARDLLHLSSPSLNGGVVPVATCDALHLLAYVGDSDGNGSYSSNDAVLITRVALQTDSGFTAYPLVDPVIVADTDGSGFIPADAALQVNEAGVGFKTANLGNPPVPPGVHFQAIAKNVDPTPSIPANSRVAADARLIGHASTRRTAHDSNFNVLELYAGLFVDRRRSWDQ